jgi:putative Ca2+/H+ antiporter (TMEM165/GDT1 family)
MSIIVKIFVGVGVTVMHLVFVWVFISGMYSVSKYMDEGILNISTGILLMVFGWIGLYTLCFSYFGTIDFIRKF